MTDSAELDDALTDLSAIPRGIAAGKPNQRRRFVIGTIVTVVVAALGLTIPLLTSDVFYLGLLVDGAILALMALGLGFLARRLGLVSLGHAAFFGVAAYGVAGASTHWGWAPLPSFVFGILAGTLMAAFMGALVVRTSGMAFLMLTLALGQAVFLFSTQQVMRPVTGGHDGLQTTFDPDATFLGIDSAMLLSSAQFWWVAWIALVAMVWLVWVVGRGRFGLILEGTRENEERMRFSGYGTFWPRSIAFAFSGFITSLGGALFALHAGYVSPDILGFLRAGDALIAALVGGTAFLLGPVVGAFLFVYAQSQFATSGNLPLYTGLALVIVIMFLPGGITGGIAWISKRVEMLAKRIRPNQKKDDR